MAARLAVVVAGSGRRDRHALDAVVRGGFDERLEGKVAIISGAARGIGGAAARLFVGEGAQVVLGDILEEEGSAWPTNWASRARFPAST